MVKNSLESLHRMLQCGDNWCGARLFGITRIPLSACRLGEGAQAMWFIVKHPQRCPTGR